MGRKATSSKGSTGQNRLVQLSLPGSVISLVVVLAGFLALGLWQMPEHDQRLLRQASAEQADQQAQRVTAQLQALRARLAAQAVGELTEILENGDDDALVRHSAALARSFPEAESVQVLRLGRLGIAALRRDEINLRNNIELDLVRRASNGELAGPEAYRVERRWLVSMAQPIASSQAEYQAGAILLTLPARHFATLLGHSDVRLGGSVLLQDGNRPNSNFAEAGSGDLSAVAERRSIEPGGWQLVYTPASTLAQRLQISRALLWTLIAVSAIAILLGALLNAQLLRRALSRNMDALLRAGGKPDLPGFADLQQRLQQRGREAAAANPESAPPPTPDAAPAAAAASAEPASTTRAAKRTTAPVAEVVETPAPRTLTLPDTIFRAYDIRGIAEQQLSDDVVYHIGLALGTEMVEQGQQDVVVARDGRVSSERILAALVRGLRDSGRDVIDTGLVPTPLLYFATHQLETGSGVMVTGSHNPAEYNGLKIVLGGRPFAGAAIQALKARIGERRFSSGKGGCRSIDIRDAYQDAILADIAVAQPLRVVLDAGNGVAGSIAPALFEALGCEVIPLFCDVDGRFPNHHPDPTVADNLQDLIQAVAEHQADLGVAFDGDGDRLGVVSGSGQIIAADQLLMLFAQDVVSRNPGADVLFDVKCSRHLNAVISQYGGRPIMWKSGHSFMKEKMLETGALLGGEFSGHIFFRERWYGFDDGLYATARLIEILSTSDPDLDRQLEAFPHSSSTPEILVKAGEEQKFSVVDQLASQGRFGDGKLITLDGVRVDFPDGWGLVRPSNTGPALVLRFEADDDAALARIQQLFRDQLAAIDPALATGF